MKKTLEKLSPRPARFAVFFVLLVYIFATSTAKPLSSMDKSEAVSVQNGNPDSNHRVIIPRNAGIPGGVRCIIHDNKRCSGNRFKVCPPYIHGAKGER